MILGVLGALVVPGWFDSPSRVEQLEQEYAARDTALTRDLVSLAEQARTEVTEMVSFAGVPSAEQLTSWKSAVDRAVARFAERPSGGTEVNLARSGFAGAVSLLDRALAAYPVSAPLGESLRKDAVVAWSVAANQLDLAGIKAGLGHVHVFLPTQGLPGEMAEHGHP
ncbi:hypothetical protein [Amycolatopsis albispora]|uniref:hypothetical protein n=1 Tax=Amycolatopsis albispora TaxID=1804986 RepID=UPI0013B41D53|nr:hypothetical protein [Amycolatopsis albispora]